jgi:predicted Zn-dependent peptidase
MYQKSVLANGVRVVSSTMPHTRSASVSLYVGAGSRYEADPVAGVSHYLEHMLFKGTERRPTAQEISETLEGIGGVANAATDKELTVYWAKVPDQHFELAFDVLADCLRHSLFDPTEVEKERSVILEELAMIEDSPGDLVGVMIDEVMWPNQPLGRDVGGSKETVGAITRTQMLDYLASQYGPTNTVVSVAGNISHEQVVQAAHEHLGDWQRVAVGQFIGAQELADSARLRVKFKKTEQAHLCIALPGLSAEHPDRYALDVFNTVLGEGMSSRLFLEVRERLSLAYDVHSYASHYQDTGSIVVAAGVDPGKVSQAVQAILRELKRAPEGVPDKELVKAREFMKGRLQLRMEDTRAVSSWLGGQELLRNEILTVDQVLALIDGVSPDDIRRVTSRLFVPDKYTLAVVGPFHSDARFKRLLAA